MFVAPVASTMFQCVRACDTLNATMPCFRTDEDYEAFWGLVQDIDQPLAWLGFFQSAADLGNATGWTEPGTNVPLNWVAPWCMEADRAWSVPWGEGQPGNAPNAPFGCAALGHDSLVVHAGCEFTLVGLGAQGC